MKRKVKNNCELPRGYLSPSSISLLLKDEGKWVRKYVYGENEQENSYMSFGRDVADFTDDDLEIKCTLKRGRELLVLQGKLDNYKNGFQYENKTSIKPWTQSQANRSLQLRIYALIHYKNFNNIPIQLLTWRGTRMAEGGLQLTGEEKIFRVEHNMVDLLETEVLCWKAYDRAIELIKIETNRI